MLAFASEADFASTSKILGTIYEDIIVYKGCFSFSGAYINFGQGSIDSKNRYLEVVVTDESDNVMKYAALLREVIIALDPGYRGFPSNFQSRCIAEAHDVIVRSFENFRSDTVPLSGIDLPFKREELIPFIKFLTGKYHLGESYYEALKRSLKPASVEAVFAATGVFSRPLKRRLSAIETDLAIAMLKSAAPSASGSKSPIEFEYAVALLEAENARVAALSASRSTQNSGLTR